VNLTRGVVLLIAGILLMSCTNDKPIAHFSPLPTTATPTPTPFPSTTAEFGTVTCSGRPSATMAVIAREFLYDVTDPIHPRLICRATNTGMVLLDNNTVGFTTVVANHVVIVRRDLTTGAESRGAQLHMAPKSRYWFGATWTWDGALEVYGTSVPINTGPYSVQVHLWSNGADHVLYTVQAIPGGIESRWFGRPILELSPDRSYLAIADFGFTISNNRVRIFGVADRRQKFVAATASAGGTWVAPDRFVWATATGLTPGRVMAWTPAGGAKVLRAESWFEATSSSDGRWLAATLATDFNLPRVVIAPLGTGRTFRTGLASSASFVTPNVVWYAEEKKNPAGYNPTSPDGVVHAFDVVNETDRIVTFTAGEVPKDTSGNLQCCWGLG
jgi:hypothetical protein